MAIMPFKVIEVGTNRKLICDFVLVISSNWHPISYRFRVIAAYCSNFGHCVFEPPFGGLGFQKSERWSLQANRQKDTYEWKTLPRRFTGIKSGAISVVW